MQPVQAVDELNPYYTQIFAFRLVRHVLHWSMKRQLRAAFIQDQYRNNPQKLCWLCGKYVGRTQRTMDHKIPESLCWALELPSLVVDLRNIGLAHERCNTSRGHTIEDLPQAIRDYLKARALEYEVVIKTDRPHFQKRHRPQLQQVQEATNPALNKEALNMLRL